MGLKQYNLGAMMGKLEGMRLAIEANEPLKKRTHLVTVLISVTSRFHDAQAATNSDRPNTIVFLIDDLGHNDAGFHGSNEIRTPNIDSAAYLGVPLTNYYSTPICTPSRAAIMSGKQPYKTGMQHLVPGGCQPYGLPLDVKIMPQYFNDLNYTSHMVGKWNLGQDKEEYLPENRGFSSFYGIRTGAHDPFDHWEVQPENIFAPSPTGKIYKGLDLWRGSQPAWGDHGTYSTRLFSQETVNIIMNHDDSNPLFMYIAHVGVHCGNSYNQLPVPMDTYAMFSYIKDESRRKLAASAWEVDRAFGELTQALYEKGILNNTNIIVLSDNGAPGLGSPDQNYGSNWPLRGNKYTALEGGTRGVGAVWSPLLKKPGQPVDNIFSIMDVLPTLYRAAGGNVKDLKDIDGVDQWNAIVEGKNTLNRLSLIYHLDTETAAIRIENWKLITKSPFSGALDYFSGSSGLDLGYQYNFTQVFTSSAYQSFSKASSNLTPQTEESVQSLRDKMTVRCNNDTLPNNQRKSTCLPNVDCLINLADDPCEIINLAEKYPAIVQTLKGILEFEQARAKPALFFSSPNSPRCDPALWNYTWITFADFPDNDRSCIWSL